MTLNEFMDEAKTCKHYSITIELPEKNKAMEVYKRFDGDGMEKLVDILEILA